MTSTRSVTVQTGVLSFLRVDCTLPRGLHRGHVRDAALSQATRVAIAYELTYAKNAEMALNITNFLKNHLFKSDFYTFYTETVNVPYPSSGLYDPYILDYGQGQDYNHLAQNAAELYSLCDRYQEYDGYIEDSLRYIYHNRNSGNSSLALIIIGQSDEYVESRSTQLWLKDLKSEGFVTTMAVSFGGYLSPLTDDPKKYSFKVNGTDPDSQQSIADKLAQLISALR